MRRLTHTVLAAVVAAVFLLPTAAAAAPASTATGADVLLLATEGEGELPGPTPRGPDATDNPGRPTDYEQPFLWATSLLILLPLAVLVGFVGLGYYLRVYRPRHSSADQSPARS